MIGLFDSGIGGLSVLRHLVRQLPAEDVVYVADQAYMPYGLKSAETIQQRAHQITEYLLNEHNCKLIAIPCNTATAAALNKLRQRFPDVPFVGMEPAVKPGARATKSGKVGVLATAGTFGSERYADLMRRFASDVVVFENPCLGLVELIEVGEERSGEVEELLRPILLPMLAEGVDTIVLGCTHYPFASGVIRSIVGDAVTIIDPTPAVVRQTERLLDKHGLRSSQPRGTVQAITTGEPQTLFVQIGEVLPKTKIFVATHSLSLV